ncbi:hypothetical protein HanXRQr2_Chr08g0339671 [Helianthus annuus]|uniref:Uncharacterized protein n=1 Tax=Helianthus annuus TaxID=4232 RepID=A0A9K3IF64_HELAN|nr:hypothetical protein HanXRQr2_Chr08g0339671 [Helianthus annuus]
MLTNRSINRLRIQQNLSNFHCQSFETTTHCSITKNSDKRRNDQTRRFWKP